MEVESEADTDRQMTGDGERAGGWRKEVAEWMELEISTQTTWMAHLVRADGGLTAESCCSMQTSD